MVVWPPVPTALFSSCRRAVLLVASLFQPAENELNGIGLLVFGSGLVVVGVVLPRLLDAVGPATGFKADAHRGARAVHWAG